MPRCTMPGCWSGWMNDMSRDQTAALCCKPDWPAAQRRWTAYWNLENTDRPLLDVRSRRAKPPARLTEVPAPRDLEALYFDPDYVSKSWLRMFETTYFGGEAVPVGPYLMAGYALGCGSGVRFAPDTVWHPVTMKSIAEPVGWHPGADDPWRHKLDVVVNRLLDLAAGRFLVGGASQTAVNDLLMLTRGTEDFLMELTTELDQCVHRLEEMFELWAETFDHYRAMVETRQQGCVYGWPGLWSPQLIVATQSDMSCMISGEMFDRYVARELELAVQRYSDTVWYHLDGPGAIRHLPRLLAKPYIRVIQWVPGAGQPGNGPAWIDLYREVQRAGRGLDLDADRGQVEYLVRHLRPEGLIIRTWAEDETQADELVEKAVSWCGTDVKRR